MKGRKTLENGVQCCDTFMVQTGLPGEGNRGQGRGVNMRKEKH